MHSKTKLISLGAGAGLIVGWLAGNIAAGMVLGAFAGLLIGHYQSRRS